MKLTKSAFLFSLAVGLLSACSTSTTTETTTTPTTEATATAKPTEVIVGKWQFDNMDMGQPVPEDKKAQWDQMMTEMKKTTTYEFTADGHLTFNSNMGGQATSKTGTWTLSEDGKKLTTNVDGKEKTEDLAELTTTKFTVKNDDGHGNVSSITFVK
jgi:hypothetical protein